ncbi:MAG: ABC transporter ATP-binding protein [Candidatus Promineifilaceae bacterium]
MMTDWMIEVDNFSKHYGDFVAVDDISFQVDKGEIFGLLGPNGAGKTSTLECLEGLRPSSSGRLRVAGVDPTAEPHKLRNLIGVQLQSAGLPATITADEVMELFCAYHDIAPRFDLLDRLGLQDKRRVEFQEMSTGLQRRLALTLAVAHEPPVLFLDEPTAGLDVSSRVELHNLMREHREKGMTIILATHDMAEAEELSDRVAILLNGKVVAIDSPMAITATGADLTKVSVNTRKGVLLSNHHPIPAVNQYLVKDQYAIYFSVDIGSTVAALIDVVQDEGDMLIDLRVERPSLEDRFLELTNGGRK